MNAGSAANASDAAGGEKLASALFNKYGSRQVNVAALSGKRLQAIPPAQRQIGRDWVPPMAALSIVRPGRVSLGHSAKLAGPKLPEAFSWRNPKDVSSAGKGKMVLGPVRNQLTCGSCWAVGAATALSHRWSIARQKTVNLSETYLLACMTEGQSQQCNGGFPLEAGSFFESKGVPTFECQPYSWCANKSECAQQGSGEAAPDSNSFIPECKEGCFECPNGGPGCEDAQKEFKLYKARSGSSKQLVTIEDIKADLYTYGPLVGAYAVMADFLTAGANNFAQSGGVYINRQTEKSPYGDQEAAAQLMGFHAVVIVGWGTQKVEGLGDVPFWEVQNSWGDAWGDGGFWKHAMSDKERDINWQVGMDIPATFDAGGQSQEIGGATIFLPDTDYVAVDGSNTNGDNSNGEPNSPSAGGGGTTRMVIGITLAGLLMLVLAVTLAMLLRC